MGKGLYRSRSVRLNEFDTRIQILQYTVSGKTEMGGAQRTQSTYHTCFARVQYLGRKTEERTEGGRETSIQQVSFTIRDFPDLAVNKTMWVTNPDTGENFDIIAIYRDRGRIGQLLDLICEIRE